ncbi:MAG: hypothetical protein ACUVWX_14140 [Kiritimatiellia bacterium]
MTVLVTHAETRFPQDTFVRLRDVPVFAAHQTQIAGKTVSFGMAELLAIAARCNRRIRETGDYVPLTIGHTPDPGDAKPDPEVIGFAGPFVVKILNGKPTIVADWYVYRDQVHLLRRYPRRSPELWLDLRKVEDSYIDPIALLGGTTPRLDMGLVLLTHKRDGKIIYQYAAVAPSATNVFVPGTDAGRSTKKIPLQQETSMPDLPDIVSQVLQALEALDWVQWAKAQASAAGASPEQAAEEAVQTEAREEKEGGQDEEKEGEKESPVQFQQPSANISPEKARQILRDGEVKGHPLSEAQRGMFGAAAGRTKQSNANAPNLDHMEMTSELLRLRNELEAERNHRRRAERYAQLQQLREQYQFDMDRELERCAPERMTDEAFADHIEVIRENYQRIPVGQVLPIGLHAGSVNSADARYNREVHERARQIAERKALRGEAVDYAEVVEQVKQNKVR